MSYRITSRVVLLIGTLTLGTIVPVVAAEPRDVSALVAKLGQGTPDDIKKAIDGLTDLGASAKDAAPALVKLLDHKDAGIRGSAARALGSLQAGDAAVVKALAAKLEDSDALVRAYSAHALGTFGAASESAAPALVKKLTDEDPAVRRQALKALRAIPHNKQESIDAAVKMLEKGTPQEVANILHSITESGPAAVPTLIKLLNRADTRHWACLVLSELGEDGAEAVPALAAVLNGNVDASGARETLLALAAIGPKAEPAVSAIAKQLSSNDNMVRPAAAYALGRIGPAANAAIPALHARLNDRDEFAQGAAHWALMKIEPTNQPLKRAGRDALVRLTGNTQPHVRRVALVALAEDFASEPAVAEAFVNLLSDENDAVRVAAEQGMFKSEAAALPALNQALRDPKRRAAALRAFRALGPHLKGALPGLIESLDTDSAEQLCEGLVGLAALGPDAASAVPQVIDVLKQAKTPEVERHAIFTLGRIGSAAAAAKPLLNERLASKDTVVPFAAAWALVRIGPVADLDAAKLLKTLTPALEGHNDLLKTTTLDALKLLGSRAKETAPAVKKLTSDPASHVQEAAVETLKAIEGK